MTAADPHTLWSRELRQRGVDHRDRAKPWHGIIRNAENVSNTGSSEVARLVEIREATPTGVASPTGASRVSIAVGPSPLQSATGVRLRMVDPDQARVSVYNFRDRLVRTHPGRPLGDGPPDRKSVV